METEEQIRERLLRLEEIESKAMQHMWTTILARDGCACMRCGTSVVKVLRPFCYPGTPYYKRTDPKYWLVLCLKCEVAVTAMKLTTKEEIINSFEGFIIPTVEPAWHRIVYGAGRDRSHR